IYNLTVKEQHYYLPSPSANTIRLYLGLISPSVIYEPSSTIPSVIPNLSRAFVITSATVARPANINTFSLGFPSSPGDRLLAALSARCLGTDIDTRGTE